MTSTATLTIIREYYLNRDGFRGMPYARLQEESGCAPEDLLKMLVRLVKRKKVILQSGKDHVDPTRITPSRPPVSNQLALLMHQQRKDLWIFPSSLALVNPLNETRYQGRPFTRTIANGASPITLNQFDSAVLTAYQKFPFRIKTDAFSGSIIYYDATRPASLRWQVLIRNFGYAYDQYLNRFIAIPTEKLMSLDPNHQEHWHQHLLAKPAMVHPVYLSLIMGEGFEEHKSIFDAFLQELRHLNALFLSLERPALFSTTTLTEQNAGYFCFMTPPCLDAFKRFFIQFQFLLLNNLNRRFFDFPSHRLIRHTYIPTNPLDFLNYWIKETFQIKHRGPFEHTLDLIQHTRASLIADTLVVDPFKKNQVYATLQRDLISSSLEGLKRFRTLISMFHPHYKEEPALSLNQERVWSI